MNRAFFLLYFHTFAPLNARAYKMAVRQFSILWEQHNYNTYTWPATYR